MRIDETILATLLTDSLPVALYVRSLFSAQLESLERPEAPRKPLESPPTIRIYLSFIYLLVCIHILILTLHNRLLVKLHCIHILAQNHECTFVSSQERTDDE